MANFDLGLFTPAGQYVVQLGPEGQAVTGPLKTGQRFASAFLTEQGSIQYKPTYGTEFLYYLRYSIIRTDADVVLYFNQAVTQALETVNAVETEDNPLPDDEIITDVELERFELAQPELFLYVILTMRSGDSVTIVLPVTAADEVTNAD
jgi:hypothetical protein